MPTATPIAMTQPWIITPPVEPSPALLDLVDGQPVVARLLAQRGFDTPDKALAFLNPEHYDPTPPTALVGVEHAAQILHDALHAGRNLFVWGDFDVDGQTSTSLLVAALQKLVGPDRIRFHVPNRFTEGHGIRRDRLEAVLDTTDLAMDLLLTCDTGIAEDEAVGYAKDRGLTVVVTDHHDLTPEFQDLTPGRDPLWGLAPPDVPGASVRRADAIVNPKFQAVGDPLRTLPGVGVAYKLIQQLYRLWGCAGDEVEFLDLVALGIVADVAEQIHDARYLLQRGLEQLRRTQRIGLLALMDVARLEPAKVDAESIGFQLGPRMNALGRLEDATVAVELLTTLDPLRAGQLAATMERLNQQRRLLTSQITAAAMEMIDRSPNLLDYNALVLAHPAWHAGIVGIVASRLTEEFNKPTVLLLNPPDQPARGSARSITGVDIGSAIAGCSHLLLGHGGHPGAAGVSLPAENIDAFRRELSRQVDLHRMADAPVGLQIDAELSLGDLSMELAEALNRLAPFGQGNPAPKFLSRNLAVVDDRRLGSMGTHRKLGVQSADGAAHSVIWFNGADVEIPAGPIDLVYHLEINEFRGERNLQLRFAALRASRREPVSVQPEPTPALTVHDLRGQTLDPARLPDVETAVWYAEGVDVKMSAGDEHQVAFAPRIFVEDRGKGAPLVLWTAPPSPELLHWLVETVEPRELYLCGQSTVDDSLPGILQGVAGMCKFALQRDKLVYIDRMAARLGTTEAVVRHSLLWLESRGMVTLAEWAPNGLPGDAVRIRAGNGEHDRENAAILQAELDEQLAEVRAYRRFFLRARLRELGLDANPAQSS